MKKMTLFMEKGIPKNTRLLVKILAAQSLQKIKPSAWINPNRDNTIILQILQETATLMLATTHTKGELWPSQEIENLLKMSYQRLLINPSLL